MKTRHHILIKSTCPVNGDPDFYDCFVYVTDRVLACEDVADAVATLTQAPVYQELLTPNTANRIERMVGWRIPFAADNGAYSVRRFSADAYLALLRRAARASVRPLFVTVPDQVGNHECTRFLFDRWLKKLAREHL